MLNLLNGISVPSVKRKKNEKLSTNKRRNLPLISQLKEVSAFVLNLSIYIHCRKGIVALYMVS